MWCTQNFAFIENTQVKDIVVCDDYDVASNIAKQIYGAEAIAFDVTHYPLQIGDTFINNRFYRDGEEILPFATVEDRLNELEGSSTNLEEATCDLDTNYSSRLADVEEALCEIAELLNNIINNEEEV